MVILGIEVHKRTHTAVAIDEHGRHAAKTFSTVTKTHLRLLRWAVELGHERGWAIDDCRLFVTAPGTRFEHRPGERIISPHPMVVP